MLIIFSSSCFAQENRIYQLSDTDGLVSNNNLTSRSSLNTMTEYPEDLLYGLEPSVYIQNNAILNVEGVTAPVVLKFKDINSFGFISTRNELYKKVEMITIHLSTIDDLQTPFNVDAIRGFNNLKYIYLKCEFSITETQIRAFIQNADPEISIFYKKTNRS
jgi:hypothetical protein